MCQNESEIQIEAFSEKKNDGQSTDEGNKLIEKKSDTCGELEKSQISVSAKEEEESINTKESISDKKEKMIMEENISVQSEDVSNVFSEEAEIETEEKKMIKVLVKRNC
jgi:hypothetical protein